MRSFLYVNPYISLDSIVRDLAILRKEEVIMNKTYCLSQKLRKIRWTGETSWMTGVCLWMFWNKSTYYFLSIILPLRNKGFLWVKINEILTLVIIPSPNASLITYASLLVEICSSNLKWNWFGKFIVNQCVPGILRISYINQIIIDNIVLLAIKITLHCDSSNIQHASPYSRKSFIRTVLAIFIRKDCIPSLIYNTWIARQSCPTIASSRASRQT